MEAIKETKINEYLFSKNKNLLDLKLIHQYLSVESYWAQNIPFTTLETAIANSFASEFILEKSKLVSQG